MGLNSQSIEVKHTEFADLFAEFAGTFLITSEGQARVTAYKGIRKQARENFDAILHAAERGEDISEAVTTHLLPYSDTPVNREAGRWRHIAPAFVSDVRVKYEASGWTRADDWPHVTRAIFDFVRRCTADPADLALACADFAASPYSKGFQTGTLTPILNALRPDDFVLVNNKSRRVINYFAGTNYAQGLADYADINAAARALLDALSDVMHKFDLPAAHAGDLFDVFCHWLVAIRRYDFGGPEVVTYTSSAEPFTQIFASREEAEWAFDLIRETLARLGVEDAEDERFALTLADGDRTLRLNFGNWGILHFTGPCYAQFRVGMALLGDHLEVIGPYDQWRPFATDDDDVEIRLCILPMETARPLTGSLRKVYERSVAYIAKRFRDWQACNYRRFNQPHLAEAVFDVEKRDELFEGDFCKETPMKVKLTTVPPYSLEHCAAETYLDAPTLSRWLRAIERKKRAVLYGPPGTGKTFLAEKLAQHLVGGGDGFWELVQFHPAYAYEDFIQGIRPQTNEDGSLSYPLVPGRFLDFCARAEGRSGTCVLILDEVNRANLARVFGELMYLLEYRDREIPLAGGGTLRIPNNVRILGTMNTADRSIALVDHALRRRFAFIALRPNYDALRRYHAHTGFDVEPLIEVLQRLNAQIADPHYEIGITFFLHEDLAEHLEDIWKMEIEPYLEEYFFDQREKAEAFSWERIQL